ncbi:4-(cytidine 5'-diphospho)-2-C-methyl-D-erythritol kinase [Neochlamydia sp. S13]|uniref:4-(cytidine 5'-diphospho)-2-C-methyl-D-erythritol kinase n=1 Tax=Neochlamydia sp. S13 TaxID=1353976 RepID=UPI0005A8BA48|nr:4-(cytidine 5'-diphospho)-2-C-methyl-D-erythritol kinase [Neochlamydia sp. S13]BBI16513.1 4-diphosphocytidyl-2-C-methyl-D-erythritol kinase [Neochlamydia sp. S13]
MLTLLAPAKINLFLRVLNRRSDGYHNLASLIQTINLHDTLHFALGSQDVLMCEHPSLPKDSSNLITAATHLFRKKTGLNFGLKVVLEKNIPMQSGLGGGSSNAATTLWALNQLHGFPVPLEQLIEWSSEIGSDVPFFLSQGTAYCTGRGEVVRCLNPLPIQRLWIAKPYEGLSTPLVFKQLDLTKISSYDPELALQSFFSNQPFYFNDLEEPAFELKPYLKTVKEELLKSGYETVSMTGSGTAFYCLGRVAPPIIPQVTFYPATFINRPAERWYPFDSARD